MTAALVVCSVLAGSEARAAGEPVPATAEWTAEAHLGGAHNFETTLRIEQAPHAAIRRDAQYETRAFEPPLYYALRVARWKDGGAWGLDLVHHKLHLANPPPEVQSFAISHGYNLLTLGHARRWRSVILWINAGAVIAHPENTVRGASLSESRGALGLGYYLAGATIGGSVAKQVALGERWFAALEAGLAGCSARVPVEGGHADVPNVALHLRAGVGRRWRRRPAAGGLPPGRRGRGGSALLAGRAGAQGSGPECRRLSLPRGAASFRARG